MYYAILIVLHTLLLLAYAYTEPFVSSVAGIVLYRHTYYTEETNSSQDKQPHKISYQNSLKLITTIEI